MYLIKFLFVATLLSLALPSWATLAIVYGAEVVSSKTGKPLLSPSKGERVKVFVVASDNPRYRKDKGRPPSKLFSNPNHPNVVIKRVTALNGKKVLVAALELCRSHYPDVPNNFPLSEFDGHCIVGGAIELRGHTLVAIGGPGDNRNLWTHAIADKTRDIAMSYITKSGILEESPGAEIVFDYFDEEGI